MKNINFKDEILLFVKQISDKTNDTTSKVTVTFGAEGDRFFVDISKGSFDDRSIIFNIFLKISHSSDMFFPKITNKAKGHDLEVLLQNSSHVIYFVNKIEDAFQTKAIMLNAFDSIGNKL